MCLVEADRARFKAWPSAGGPRSEWGVGILQEREIHEFWHSEKASWRVQEGWNVRGSGLRFRRNKFESLLML